MLIDFHTHGLSNEKQNYLRFVMGKQALGIHPWELIPPFEEALYEKKIQELKKNVNSSILAIGECGLDRRREGIAPIEMQGRVFGWHLDWAIESRRPVIIHCVKAQSDLLKILKDKKFNGKMLLHDYAGNKDESDKFLAYDCYFSFGRRLLGGNSRQAELFKSLPVERLFLETDDQQEIKIEVLYQKAQAILGLDPKRLEALFEHNLVEFFSDLDNISPADIINNLS